LEPGSSKTSARATSVLAEQPTPAEVVQAVIKKKKPVIKKPVIVKKKIVKEKPVKTELATQEFPGDKI
jgi:hypothetical protein